MTVENSGGATLVTIAPGGVVGIGSSASQNISQIVCGCDVHGANSGHTTQALSWNFGCHNNLMPVKKIVTVLFVVNCK